MENLIPEGQPELKGFTKIGTFYREDDHRYIILYKRGCVLCTMNWDGVSVDPTNTRYDVLLDEVV